MTSVTAEQEVERWILEDYLPKQFNHSFRSKKLPLQSRGETKFAAVSDDSEVVAAICVKPGYGANGKVDTEALMKVRSDALKLLWLEHTPAKRFMIFTESSMMRLIREEIKKGHFPKEVEIVRVKLPAVLVANIDESQVHATDGIQSNHDKAEG